MYISSLAANYGLPNNTAYHFSAFESRWRNSETSRFLGAQSCGRGYHFNHSVGSGFSELLERVAVRSGLTYVERASVANAVYEGFRPFVEGQKLTRRYSADWFKSPMLTGFDLIHRRWENIPEELVLFRRGSSTGARCYPEIDTTGFSASPNLGDAVFSGILELVEKNSLVLMWLGRKVLAEIRMGAETSERLETLGSVATRFGLRPRFFDISFISGFKTVFVMALSSTQFPYFSVGAASALSEVEACESALNECIQLHISYSEMLYRTRFEIENNFGSHASNYLSRNNKIAFETDFSFLEEKVSVRTIDRRCSPSSRDWLEACERDFFPSLSRLLFVPFKASAFPNYSVCRVVSPDLFWGMIPQSLDLPLNRKLLQDLYPEVLRSDVTSMLVFP